ncbi:MAG TPA: glycosyl hydrolase family 18 protein [Dinghuibacter sp.]|uniref:glycosyl hydrolase family 18 protein n=1 Tax=Dinghuibacter sp. TaxID=2024697 RepID=UPI002C0B45D9|nr:glycosyl hydrolase family 18 protein [Dinghuibacter sp.]HTJ14042.1 glycosyl hydrolase family 18 protein [Dinghuibacter sp.]
MKCVFVIAILLSFTFCVHAAPVVNDSIPVQKEAGLIKRVLQFFQFARNARAKQQKLIQQVIASTGLQKTLDSVQKTLAVQSTGNASIDSLLRVLAHRVDDLAASEKKDSAAIHGPPSKQPSALPGDSVDLAEGGDFQNLVAQLMPMLQPPKPVSPEVAADLLMKRTLLARGGMERDTLKVNDSLSRTFVRRIDHSAQVTWLYPSWSQPALPEQTFSIISGVDYYGATFQGATGSVDYQRWYTDPVLRQAGRAGADIYLTLYANNASEIAALFARPAVSEANLIRNIHVLLDRQGVKGLTIYFPQLPATADVSAHLVGFMDRLSDSLRLGAANYRVNLVIPRSDERNQYKLPLLQQDVDEFFIDFTQSPGGGPLAPLTGARGKDLTSCVKSWLTVSGFSPDRFVVMLPFFGVTYQKTSPRYLGYERIRSVYAAPPGFDQVTQCAYVDSPGLARVWFDDAQTLGLKYDFIRQTGLAGVAIRSLDNDIADADLQEVLMTSFLRVDTVYGADIRKVRKPVIPFTGWKFTWPYLTAKYEQYEFLFAYPCLTDFPKVVRKRWSQMGITDLDRSSVEDEATRAFACFTIFWLLLLGASVFLFAWKIRRDPRWVFRRYMMALMVVFAVLVTISGFMFLYVTKAVGGFGTSADPQDCYDFPLSTLFGFIVTGLVIGGVITRYLVFPLVKKDHIP